MEIFQKVCLVLTIIGGINWGLVGLFNFNLVHFIVGNFDRFIYIIVGISSLINIGILFNDFE